MTVYPTLKQFIIHYNLHIFKYATILPKANVTFCSLCYHEWPYQLKLPWTFSCSETLCHCHINIRMCQTSLIFPIMISITIKAAFFFLKFAPWISPPSWPITSNSNNFSRHNRMNHYHKVYYMSWVAWDNIF